MSWKRILSVVMANIQRNRRTFLLSSLGLVVGVTTLTFFLALGSGVQRGVLNRIYPVNQIEVEPRSVAVLGLRADVVDPDRLGEAMISELKGLPGVTAVFPKVRSKLQARLWGGKALFGWDAKAEAFFDGLSPAVLLEELQRGEEGARGRPVASDKGDPCVEDPDCPLGQMCAPGADGDSGRCVRIAYWQRFQPQPLSMACRTDTECVQGEDCLDGYCRRPCDDGCTDDAICVRLPGCEGRGCRACVPACDSDDECPASHACVGHAEDGRGCLPRPCGFDGTDGQFSEQAAVRRGRQRGRCANGVRPENPACESVPCPLGTYCALPDMTRPVGFCERPLPVVLNPFLVEVFNSTVAGSLELQPIDGREALLGVRFQLQLGNSFFKSDLPASQQMLKWAEIVGFSHKAMDLGVTLPIEDVRRFNARYRGRDLASRFDTAILETQTNEDVSGLITALEDRGFTLARRSRDARKAADLLFILTLVFSFISIVIMGVAAANITHTFLMLVSERRHEIAIMRAVGATQRQVRALVLTEAGLLGLFGGVVGGSLSVVLAFAVNLIAARLLVAIPFKPDDFFHFDLWILVGGILFAIFFCLLGALVPAHRAARLDPAVVLSQ